MNDSLDMNINFEKPRNSNQALQLKEESIEHYNYELAEFYEKEYAALKNYEDVLKLGTMVSAYYDVNEEIACQAEKHFKITRADIEDAKEKSKIHYEKAFNDLKQQHENELNDIISEWLSQSNDIKFQIESDYQSSLKTSRLIAKNSNYRKAIEIRDNAKNQKEHQLQHQLYSVDSEFKQKCDLLKKRHRIELEGFVNKRRAELKSFDLITESFENKSLCQFLVDNASAVVNISQYFRSFTEIPTSFRMQTVRARNYKIQRDLSNDSI